MKKILFYIGSLNSGGAERQLVYTVLGFKDKGYEVKILTNYDINKYDFMLKKKDVEVICTNTTNKNVIIRFIKIAKVILDYKPDIVNSFLGSRNIEMMFMAKILGVKKRVASIRNVSEQEFKGIKIFKHFSTDLITNSYKAKDQILKRHKNIKNLNVVHNGLDINRFKNLNSEYLREELGLYKYKKIGICIGRIIEQKNHIELLKALVDLFKEKRLGEKDLFLLVGNCIDKEILKKIKWIVKDNNLENNIKWIGPRKDIENLLDISDYLVLPSKYEGFPNVVMEAMASKTFVIATDVGGTRELINNNKTGILVKKSINEDIKNGISQYLKSFSEEEKIIKNQAYGFIKSFSIEKLVEKNIDIYKGRK